MSLPIPDRFLWQLSEGEGGLTVTLGGDFTEESDFAPLTAEIPRGHVALTFDLSGLRYMNSMGLKRWLDFLGGLDAQASYRFVRCSVPFVLQVGLLPLAAGRGALETVHVPYRCAQCDRESLELVTTAALPTPPRVPALTCQCGGRATLDDLPERFFAFLQ